MKKTLILISTLVVALPLWAQRIEVGDDISRIETKTSGYGTNFRATHRLGAGLSFMGATGSAGMNMEINFSPSWGIIAGLGTSSEKNFNG